MNQNLRTGEKDKDQNVDGLRRITMVGANTYMILHRTIGSFNEI